MANWPLALAAVVLIRWRSRCSSKDRLLIAGLAGAGRPDAGRPRRRGATGRLLSRRRRRAVRAEHFSIAVILRLGFNNRAVQALPTFTGLEYYGRVMCDPTVWDGLHTTAIIVVLTVTAQMVVGFLLALLFAKEFPLRRYLLILVLTPMMLSYVAMGAFFRYYYEPTFGLLSQMVLMFTGQRFVLLQSTAGAMAGIVFADAWMWSPFVAVVLWPHQRAEIFYKRRRSTALGMAAVLGDHLSYMRFNAGATAPAFGFQHRLPADGRRSGLVDRRSRSMSTASPSVLPTSESTALAYILLFAIVPDQPHPIRPARQEA